MFYKYNLLEVQQFIEPKTIYIVTDKQCLGCFARSKGKTSITLFHDNTTIGYTESFLFVQL